jgi:hypothetical protein
MPQVSQSNIRHSNQYVMVPNGCIHTQTFHLLNMPPYPPRYDSKTDDDLMIASDDLTVFPESKIFYFSQMELQYASWMRLAQIPIFETVLSQSTSNSVVDPVVESSLLLYTTRLPALRPVSRVLDIFPVVAPEPSSKVPTSPLVLHPTTTAFFTSWCEGRIIGTL